MFRVLIGSCRCYEKRIDCFTCFTVRTARRCEQLQKHVKEGRIKQRNENKNPREERPFLAIYLTTKIN